MNTNVNKMSNWKMLKNLYLKDNIDKKKLVTPQTKIDALLAIETIMNAHFPAFIKQPKFLKQIPADQFLKELKLKKGSPLKPSETSVVNGLYKVLPEL